MRFRNRFLLLLASFFISTQCYSSHVAGTEIFYKHISGNKYEITVYHYYDCFYSISNIFDQPVTIIPDCNTDSISVPMVKFEEVDITPIPNLCNDSSVCKGGIPYGVTRLGYRGVVTLPATCCEFTIKSALYYSIKFGTTYDKDLSVGALLNINRCRSASSPVFEFTPSLFLRLSQPQHISFKTIDTSKIEFITYEMVPFTAAQPPSRTLTGVPYFSGFTQSRPFSILGSSSTRKDFPRGFFFDTLTGEMTFRPILSNQVTATAVKAKKWKKINDTLRVVSEAIRQIICEVIPAGNNLPNFKSFDNELAVCPDTGLYWFEIPISDADSKDTLYLSYIHKLGSKLQISDSGSHNNKVVKVGYRVDSNTIKNKTMDLLTISAADSACPLNGVNRKTFKFVIKPYLPDSFSIDKSLVCRDLTLKLNNNSSVLNPDAEWRITSLRDTTTLIQKSPSLKLRDSGWHKIRLTVSSDAYCSVRTYYDSIYLSQIAFLNMQTPADTVLCFDSTVTLAPIITNGTVPIKYTWSTGDTTPTINITTTSPSKQYWVSGTDANNCSIPADTINVYYYHPKVSLSGDKEVCVGNSIQLNATLADTIAPTFGWTGFNTSTQLIDKPNQNTQYRFSLTDASGCKVDTTWGVVVYDPKIQFTHNNDVCRGDSLTFSASADSGKVPYSYNWITLNKKGQNVKIATQGLSLGFVNATIEVTDSFGCKVVDATKAFVKPKPIIKFTTIPVSCIGSGLINLKPYSTPQGGIWIGKGVDTANNNLNPLLTDTGINPLKYVYTDSTFNCTDSGSSLIKIEPANTANFTANKTTGEEGDTINFTNTSTTKNINNSKWSFGDPNSGTLNTFTGKETSHIYNDSGLYTVQLIVTGGVCPDDTLIKVDYITINKKPKGPNISVREINQNNLKLYPNPSKNKLTIEADNPLIEIVLVDILGKRHEIENFTPSTKAEINIAHLAAGIYIIEAKDIEGNIYTSKVQVSK